MRFMTAAALAVVLAAGSAGAAFADPIEGNWKTKSGETAAIAKCGSAFCITLKTGKYSGKRIGSLSGSDGTYAGEITDPKSDKTYNGKAALAGDSMKLSGCVLGGLICRGENWSKM